MNKRPQSGSSASLKSQAPTPIITPSSYTSRPNTAPNEDENVEEKKPRAKTARARDQHFPSMQSQIDSFTTMQMNNFQRDIKKLTDSLQKQLSTREEVVSEREKKCDEREDILEQRETEFKIKEAEIERTLKQLLPKKDLRNSSPTKSRTSTLNSSIPQKK